MSRLIHKLLLATLIVLGLQPAAFAQWALMSETDDYWVAINFSSIAPTGDNQYRVWIRQQVKPDSLNKIREEKFASLKKFFPNKRQNPFAAYSYHMLLEEFDITNSANRIITCVYYDENGRVIPEGGYDGDGKWHFIVPNSLGESWFRYVKGVVTGNMPPQ